MDDARTLLNTVPALQRPCDLDLVLFFARHWRALLSSEQLARLLGYPLQEIARSRDALVAAGWLTRVHDPSRSERLYVFEPEGVNAEVLPAILALASTPGGRFALRRALSPEPVRGAIHQSAQDENSATRRDAQSHRNVRRAKRSQPSERRSSEQPERTHGRS
jgi:hypothetical protein